MEEAAALNNNQKVNRLLFARFDLQHEFTIKHIVAISKYVARLKVESTHTYSRITQCSVRYTLSTYVYACGFQQQCTTPKDQSISVTGRGGGATLKWLTPLGCYCA